MGHDVAADGGGLTVLGSTDGEFGGSGGTLGIDDLFVRRYDRDGDKLWTRQFGTAKDEDPGAIAADDGGLIRRRDHAGRPDRHQRPRRPRRLRPPYDRPGNVEWTRQFGTTDGDTADAVAIDGAGFTVGGGTDGDLQATTPARSPTRSSAATTSPGTPSGPASGARRATTRCCPWRPTPPASRPSATRTPTRRATSRARRSSAATTAPATSCSAKIFGSPDSEIAWGVAADADAITVTGYTFGDLDADNKGSFDVFVRRYDRTGTLIWKPQFGTGRGRPRHRRRRRRRPGSPSSATRTARSAAIRRASSTSSCAATRGYRPSTRLRPGYHAGNAGVTPARWPESGIGAPTSAAGVTPIGAGSPRPAGPRSGPRGADPRC